MTRLGCIKVLQLFCRKIQYILDDPTEVSDEAEAKLAVMTASERTTWANLREARFRHGINKASLDIIESAAFVLVLDDMEYNYDEVRQFSRMSNECLINIDCILYAQGFFCIIFQNDPEKLNQYAASMLHGKGYDRWYDKSLCFVVARNGRAGVNVEHSW